MAAKHAQCFVHSLTGSPGCNSEVAHYASFLKPIIIPLCEQTKAGRQANLDQNWVDVDALLCKGDEAGSHVEELL